MNLNQIFAFESLKYYYKDNKELYIISNSRSRNKTIILPRIYKTVSEKNNHIKSIKLFNQLPNDLKILDIEKIKNIKKIKEWIIENIL